MFLKDQDDAALGAGAARFAAAEGFEDVNDIILGRCAMCHAAEPAWDGMLWPPKGVRLETKAQVARMARDIYLRTCHSWNQASGRRSLPGIWRRLRNRPTSKPGLAGDFVII